MKTQEIAQQNANAISRLLRRKELETQYKSEIEEVQNKIADYCHAMNLIEEHQPGCDVSLSANIIVKKEVLDIVAGLIAEKVREPQTFMPYYWILVTRKNLSVYIRTEELKEKTVWQ